MAGQTDSYSLACRPESRVLAPLQVVAVHRRMSRHSSALLITASDTATYIMKINSPEMPHKLFREAFGNEAGTRLGLRMTPWAVLQVDREAFAADSAFSINPQLLVDIPNGNHFGSRVFIKAGPTLEILPSSVKNFNPEVISALAAVQLFDLWIGHGERRQYIARLNGKNSIDLRFIRNSCILADEGFHLLQPARAEQVFRQAYRMCSARDGCDNLMKELLNLPTSALEKILEGFPASWMAGLNVADVLEHLKLRRAMLENLWLTWKKTDFHSISSLPHAKMSPTGWVKECRTSSG